jgi:PHD/YefM family antitoxin component YafN of YafNO toxin-antitoxin module
MTAAAQPASEDLFARLQRKPVSDVKREGWRGVMGAVDAAGKVLMTRHERPEAVILSLREYSLLTELAGRTQRDDQSKLEQLALAFDAELAVLQQPDAGDRLRQAFGAPLALNGEVIAGRSY